MHAQFENIVSQVRSVEAKLAKRRSVKSPTKKTNLNKSLTSSLNLSMRSSDSGKPKEPMYI